MSENAPLWMWLVPAVSSFVGVAIGALLQYFTATKQMRADAEHARYAAEADKEREEREARRDRNQKLAADAFAFIQTAIEMHRIRLILEADEDVLIDGKMVPTGAAVLRRDQLTAECWGWMMMLTAADEELGLRARRVAAPTDTALPEKQVMSFRQRLALVTEGP